MGAAQSITFNTVHSPTKIFTNEGVKPEDASDIHDLFSARKELERYCHLLPSFINGTDGDAGLLDVCRKQIAIARRKWSEETAVYQELIDVTSALARTVTIIIKHDANVPSTNMR
jgi:hypothetical protein